MAKIIDNRNNGIDNTVRLFDSFYQFNTVVNSNEYDIVHGYFLSSCDTTLIADNFTTAIFRISQYTGIPATTLLDYIRGDTTGDGLQMDRTLAYFLNTLKSKTALYGIAQIPRPNQPVARNILQ